MPLILYHLYIYISHCIIILLDQEEYEDDEHGSQPGEPETEALQEAWWVLYFHIYIYSFDNFLICLPAHIHIGTPSQSSWCIHIHIHLHIYIYTYITLIYIYCKGPSY